MSVSAEHAIMEEWIEPNLLPLLERLGKLEGGAQENVAEEAPATFTELQVREKRADRFFLIKDRKGKLLFCVLIEVQRKVSPKKLAIWNHYVAEAYARYGVPVLLIVITDNRQVERWASEPIETHKGEPWHPLVLGPTTLPQVFEPAGI